VTSDFERTFWRKVKFGKCRNAIGVQKETRMAVNKARFYRPVEEILRREDIIGPFVHQTARMFFENVVMGLIFF
jgi:hypothetical protein